MQFYDRKAQYLVKLKFYQQHVVRIVGINRIQVYIWYKIFLFTYTVLQRDIIEISEIISTKQEDLYYSFSINMR